MWKTLLTLALAAGVIVGGVLLYQNRHRLFRPNFARAGGTRLVYAIDGDSAADRDDVVQILQRRFDPTGAAGIAVTSNADGEIVVAVPFGDKHKDRVEQVKRLAERAGRLEFRMVARNSEDGRAVTAAIDTLKLRGAAAKTPPPPPQARDGSSRFHATVQGEPEYTYGWTRLTPAVAKELHLDEATMRHSVPTDLTRVAAALKTGEAFAPSMTPELLVAVRQPDPKLDPVFFVLTRQESADRALTSEHIERAWAIRDYRSRYPVTLRLNPEGTRRLYSVSSKGLPGWVYDPLGQTRQVVLVDDEVVATLTPTSRRNEATLPGDFMQQEAEDLAMLIQGGTLPARLKLTREEEVKPR